MSEVESGAWRGLVTVITAVSAAVAAIMTRTRRSASASERAIDLELREARKKRTQSPLGRLRGCSSSSRSGARSASRDGCLATSMSLAAIALLTERRG